MKILLVLLSVLLTSCGVFGYKRMTDRIDNCIKEYLKYDVEPKTAYYICDQIFRKSQANLQDKRVK